MLALLLISTLSYYLLSKMFTANIIRTWKIVSVINPASSIQQQADKLAHN